MVIDFRTSMNNTGLLDTAPDYSRGYIMQSRTIMVLKLIPDKERSKALALFIAMRSIINNFLVHLHVPRWHNELRVCKEKQIKLL